MTITIYHNPQCSNSRQTLSIIEAAGETPEIILYLDTPPTPSEILAIREKLGFQSVRDMMRTGEDIYQELGLDGESDELMLAKAMAAHPRLMQRPVVIKGERAVMGRPPENVLPIL